MCSIFGAILNHVVNDVQAERIKKVLNMMYGSAYERGRDGRGYVQNIGRERGAFFKNIDRQFSTVDQMDLNLFVGDSVFVGNMRAEPTTEFVQVKHISDQQPYSCGQWAIVHNGTIANDRDLRTGELGTNIDSAAIAEQLELASHEWAALSAFHSVIVKLKGSFAILAMNRETPGVMYYACNYRPIWYIKKYDSIFFASTRRSFEQSDSPQMIAPYTMGAFTHGGKMTKVTLQTPQWPYKQRSLVVCSGGMDSVVSAAAVIAMGHEVELVHFQYGSRAEGPEVKAILAVAAHYNVPLYFKALPNVWDIGDSPLLQHDSKIAGGEAGAEFAHEWVPARNLVMLAVATAFAEAKGFDNIILGNNLEEAGSYPDNEPEFIDRFNDLLPFAIGDGKKVRILMPVGNMMKHEIVEYGLALKAPLHLTWSCYRSGMLHCGKCGPCFMRRTAFQINHTEEVIEYEQ